MKPKLKTRSYVTYCKRIVPVYLNDWGKDFDKIFSYIISRNLFTNSILIGDFNAWIGKEQFLEEDVFVNAKNVWNERKSNGLVIDSKGRKLLSKLNDCNLVVLNGRSKGDEMGSFTYKKNNKCSVIDFAICSANLLELVEEFKVIWSDLSDHNQICLKLCLNLSVTKQDRNSSVTLLPKIRWNKNNMIINNFNVQQAITNGNFSDINLVKIKEIIQSVFTSQDVSNKYSKFKEKWYDKELLMERNKSFYFLNKWRKCRVGRSENDQNCQNLYELYRNANKNYIEKCTEKKRNYFASISKKLSEIRNSSDWWKWTKLLKDDNVMSNGNVKMTDLVSQFSSLLFDPNLEGISFCEPFVEDVMLDSNFSIDELDLALMSLKDNKAVGEDRIPIECYKYGPECLKNLLVKCFNEIYNGKESLTENKPIIVALFKKENKDLASNYRGISLINSLNKLLGRIIYNRLNSWVRNRKILTEF